MSYADVPGKKNSPLARDLFEGVGYEEGAAGVNYVNMLFTTEVLSTGLQVNWNTGLIGATDSNSAFTRAAPFFGVTASAMAATNLVSFAGVVIEKGLAGDDVGVLRVQNAGTMMLPVSVTNTTIAAGVRLIPLNSSGQWQSTSVNVAVSANSEDNFRFAAPHVMLAQTLATSAASGPVNALAFLIHPSYYIQTGT